MVYRMSSMISNKRNAAAVAPDAAPAVSSSTLWNSNANAQPIGMATVIVSIGLSAFWGGNVVALKIGLDTFPPFWSALWRMSSGLVVAGRSAWAPRRVRAKSAARSSSTSR
jgi:drug/metabolite transporter (DMT)-like permease